MLQELANKTHHTENDKLAFYLEQAKIINSKSYARKALELISAPPEYTSLYKKGRHRYAPLHSLIDVILPIVSGSSSSAVQKELLEAR